MIGVNQHANVKRYIGLVLAMLGVGAVWWFLWESSIDAKIWNSIPYMSCFFLAFVSRAAFPAAVATAFMLASDAFLATSVLLETRSSWLLAFSLVSTLKLVIVLPIGLVIGWLIQKRLNPKPAEGSL